MDYKLSFLDRGEKWNDASHVTDVVQQICKFPNLQVLELRGNTLGVEAGEAIAEALKRHPELKYCLWGDLFTTRLRDEIPRTVKSLCAAMIYANASITELDLSDNAFGPIGAESIKDFLESRSAYSLKVLKLNNCGLGSGGQTVAASLIKCHQLAAKSGRKFELKTFSACRNRLENPGAKALAEAFNVIGTLERIILYQNGINAPGIIALAESFRRNPELREIDLSDNTATEKADCLCRDAGCHAIVEALNPEIHTDLNVVNLSGAELTPEAAVSIAPKMEKFDDVSLKIGCNNFGHQFEKLRGEMPSFVDCGESEDDCGTLDSDEEYRSEPDEDETNDSLMAGTSNTPATAIVQGLDDVFKQMDVRDVKPSNEPISANTTLSFLGGGAKWNNTSDVSNVVQQILQVRNLQTLELRGNTLGVEAGEAIAEALKRHPELKYCLWGDLFTTRLRDEIPRTVKSLCAAMIYANASITELDLSDNAFGPIGAESIKDFLESRSACSLKVLKLNNCGLGSGGQTVAASLIKCHQLATKSGRKFELKTFSACRNRLENPGAKALAEAFKVIGTLEEVILYQNGINPPGIIMLAESFQMNPELREIDLSDNTATEKADCLCRDAGCHAIVDALNPEIHINLNVVNLSGAELTPEAAVLIVPKMEKFDDVSLKIGCNNFGHKFNALRDWMPPFVDCGDAEDDCGTLDDDEELQSDFDDEEGDEEETESSMSENENKTFDESFKQLTVDEKAGTSLSFLGGGAKWDKASDVSNVVQQICKFPNLQVLELRGNTLGVEAGEAIAEALKRHPELKYCLWGDLFTTRLRDEIPRTVKSLCAAMIYANASITELDLSDNAFGPIGAESIKDFLESRSAYSLKVLKLNNCGLGSGGQTVAASLIKCHQLAAKSGRKFELETFSACRNRLENPGAKALAEAFKVITTLEEIVLYQNGINAPGIIALAGSFQMNPELREIDLSDNTATEKADCLCRDAGCHAIVDALNPEIHTDLNVVNLSGAELTPEAAVSIAPKMEKFDDVSLKIGCNNFGHQFEKLRGEMPSFVDCGESEDDCGTLDSDEEYRSEPDEDETNDSLMAGTSNTPATAIVQGLDDVFKQMNVRDVKPSNEPTSANTTLSFLGGGAKWNNASDVLSVVQQITQFPNLQVLELRGNTLGVEAGEAIAEALKRHPELKYCLWGDLFTTRLRDEIPRTVKSLCAAMIYANASITELDLSDNAFGPIGAESIKDFLESRSAYSLKVLKLNNCGLGSGGQTVAASLIKCHQLAAKSGRKFELETFSACRNRLENPGAKALAEAFNIIGSLERIILYQNGINAPGIIALAESFRSNPELREIDLSDNTATEKADCLCRDAGCHAIVEALNPEIHINLNVVNLSGAELTPEAAVLIVPEMEKFDDVSLKIGCNNFGHKFNALRDWMPPFVDCGESEDDCGTLDDDEERKSDSDEEE
ncbi:unnamed protein product, partial [Mesorhabditis belari]|uniref:Ran GTPase-activating protein n=1 Tax=Mesorhabditis belari TaxID=2138241 RepID=A0AAF3ETS1_9BILA